MIIPAIVFDLDKLTSEKKQIETDLQKPEIYSDFENSNKLSKKLAEINRILNFALDTKGEVETLSELYELYQGIIPESDQESFMISLK